VEAQTRHLNDTNMRQNLRHIFRFLLEKASPKLDERKEKVASEILIVNHEGKQQLGKFRHRWQDNIEVNILILEGMDGIYLAQNREQRKSVWNTVI
jgi:hypothetical protein